MIAFSKILQELIEICVTTIATPDSNGYITIEGNLKSKANIEFKG